MSLTNKQNHYKLIGFAPKKNSFKVQNFKENQVEIYSLRFQNGPAAGQQSFKKISPSKKKFFFEKGKEAASPPKDLALKTLFSLYKKYQKYSFLSYNPYFFKFLYFKYLKIYKHQVADKSTFQRFYDKSFLNLSSGSRLPSPNSNPAFLTVYLILRRNNLFITVSEDGAGVKKTFSCGSCGLERQERKRSPSFFFVVKKTLLFLKPYIRASRDKFVFRLVFKGFKRFRRPLLNRFLYNKGFKSKCVGISNLDFEPFNGCRKKKSKRVKLKRKK